MEVDELSDLRHKARLSPVEKMKKYAGTHRSTRRFQQICVW